MLDGKLTSGTFSAKNFASQYLKRPSLEYTRVFDIIADEFNDCEDQLLAIISSNFHLAELIKRFQVPLYISFTGVSSFQDTVQSAWDWAWGGIRVYDLQDRGRKFATIIWAEPQIASADEILESLRYVSARGTRLMVVNPSILRKYLPEWHGGAASLNNPLNRSKLTAKMENSGWQIVQQVGFHGMRAILWGMLGRLSENLPRPDWADRCHHGMRRDYLEEGRAWWLSPLTLISARRV